jgi:hypothetical protein
LVWSARHDLHGWQHAGLYETTDRVWGDAESRRRVPHGQPFAILLRGKIGVDSVHSPKRADPMRGPRFALTGSHAHAI